MTAAPRPPLVKGLPWIGPGLALARNPEQALQGMHQQYGPVFRFKTPLIDAVCMAGPEANAFANTEGKDVLESRTFWKPLTEELDSPNAVVALDGEPHRQMRKILKPAFSRDQIDQNIPVLAAMIRKQFDAYPDDTDLPLVFASQKLTSNIVGHLLMGSTPDDHELEEFFHYANRMTVWLSVLRLPAKAMHLTGGPRFKRAQAITAQVVDNAVRKALTEPHDRPLLANIMTEARRHHPELFTDGDIRSTGFLAFFAGIDTIGQTLVFMLWELLRNPDALREVQAEVDRVFSNGLPDAQSLATDLPLCRNTFLETLRLHPTAFGIMRNAACDFVFNGHQVLKGENVLLYTTACHRDARYFDHPDAFDVHRHDADRETARPRHVFVPFGRGAHTCAGAAWSEAQAVLMLSVLLHHYQFSLPENMKDAKVQMRTTPTLGKDFRIHLIGKRPH
ncbi:MAG: cytochrome P450 [Gammaproteobacteria bacterium]|nr:MAG: cytochrome P450 [Gammaproteobacteria bacterium]